MQSFCSFTMLNLINTFRYIYELVIAGCQGVLYIPSRTYTVASSRSTILYIYVLDTGEYHVPMHIPKRICSHTHMIKIEK